MEDLRGNTNCFTQCFPVQALTHDQCNIMQSVEPVFPGIVLQSQFLLVAWKLLPVKSRCLTVPKKVFEKFTVVVFGVLTD